MATWFARALTVFLVAMCLPRPAHAQDAISGLIGRPVTAIRFEIEGRVVTSADLESMVPLRTGDALRLEAVRDAESHLMTAGRYSDVTVTFSTTAAGVDLVFRLTPRHPIDRIEFTGDTGLSASELERLIRERYAGLPAREQPRDVAQALTGMLHDEGFPDARVEPKLEITHDPDRATLVLDVAAGPRPAVARTDVTGQSPLSTAKIIELTDTAPGRPFRRADLEARLASIEDDLRKQGYFSAVAILPNEPVPSAAPPGLIVSLLVEAGPKVALRWDPADGKPAGDEENFVPMRRQRSVDEDLLEDSDERVAAYWRRDGYRDVAVTHSREQRDGQLVIVMRVDRGRRHVVNGIRITGDKAFSESEVLERLGVRVGAPYDASQIVTGIGRLRAGYLARGFHRVAIKELDPEEAPHTTPVVPLTVLVDVAEGPQGKIGALSLRGVAPEREAAVRRAMASTPGGPYVRETTIRDRDAVEAYYRNLGFEDVDVKIAPAPNADGSVVDLAVDVSEGSQITIGEIRVVGNRRVSEKAITQQLALKAGQPLGEAARRESARRLSQMGVFRLVSVEEEPRASGETQAHVIVTVEELPATSIGYGGGLEGGRQPLKTADGTFDDRTFVAPRGFFEIGRRNLWGKNRSIDFFSRIAPRPTTSTSENFGFLEYRVSGTYREPRAFDADNDLTLGISSEQAARTGFNFARRSASLLLLRRFSPRVSASGRYALEFTRLFDVNIREQDKPIIARIFPQVRLSTLSTSVVWDRRDDVIDPSRGTLFVADGEVALRGLGSQVGYDKVFLQAAGFRALPTARRVILAGRAEIGLARGFERTVVDDNGQQQTVAEVPVSQRFFAGGSTSVRGFQLDRLGVIDPAVPERAVIKEDGLSVGGNGIVVANAEVRARVGKLFGREIGVAGFTDVGNVFAKASDINLTKLRATVGFGIRYNSPLGPVRFDVGFKTDRQVVAGRLERGWEYHLNIGEAF